MVEQDPMIERVATCRCGQLRIVCQDDPVRVSVCHCFECQKRSGSAFAGQARFAQTHAQPAGQFSEYSSRGESGATTTFHFCPNCGSTVFYASTRFQGFVAVAVGAFADADLPAPSISLF
ncbi:MAG: GFA family protein [Pseudomonadales bacterium]|uniref:GFA family protein n=1 Tax=Stenotrophomonas sp. SRS1 TaxID=2870345 RepID=UPI002237EA7C|nr:GFA family protein [Stenotrophomonas sp. SRS1]MCW6026472.1 GFA family protein [Stenotrophomonas sp. SRS1]